MFLIHTSSSKPKWATLFNDIFSFYIRSAQYLPSMMVIALLQKLTSNGRRGLAATLFFALEFSIFHCLIHKIKHSSSGCFLSIYKIFNGISIFASRSLGAEQLHGVYLGCRTEDLSLHCSILLRAPPQFSIDRVSKVPGRPGPDTKRNGSEHLRKYLNCLKRLSD